MCRYELDEAIDSSIYIWNQGMGELIDLGGVDWSTTRQFATNRDKNRARQGSIDMRWDNKLSEIKIVLVHWCVSSKRGSEYTSHMYISATDKFQPQASCNGCNRDKRANQPRRLQISRQLANEKPFQERHRNKETDKQRQNKKGDAVVGNWRIEES